MYGAEEIVLIEFIVLSSCLSIASKVSDFSDRIYDMEALEEKRQNTKEKLLSYQTD